MAYVRKLSEGVLSKRAAERLLNRICENAGFQEHAVITIAHLAGE
jgi:hypothetical protein